MKECKDIDPARTDRVSVWISKADKSLVNIYELIPNIGININHKNISGDILTNFKF